MIVSIFIESYIISRYQKKLLSIESLGRIKTKKQGKINYRVSK